MSNTIACQFVFEPGEYDDAVAAAVSLNLETVACPEFVDYVERGITSGPELIALAETYLATIKEAGVDTLVLGCTHYPLLTGALSYVMGDDVTLVSSAVKPNIISSI